MFKAMQYIFAFLIAIVGVVLMNNAMPILNPAIDSYFGNMGMFSASIVKILATIFGGIVGFIIGFLLSKSVLQQGLRFTRYFERLLSHMPVQDLATGGVGLLFGLIIANLIGVAFYRVPYIGPFIPIALSAIFGYTGLRIMSRKGRDFYETLVAYRQSLGRRVDSSSKETDDNSTNTLGVIFHKENASEVKRTVVPKLVDTSAIIDGRIEELSKTGFLEGPLIVPFFVLEELQHISDSNDELKRARGRRGLDILKSIQQGHWVEVIVIDDDYDDITEVDSKLMRMAVEKKWKIITNDFNLNKVAVLQGISVLNINELANALKSAMVAGECFMARVIKAGKENQQGIAYLDDGTMIVIEKGALYIGKTVEVEVTSVLQTSAGRMIFARIKGE